jgi:hypothetical protein
MRLINCWIGLLSMLTLVGCIDRYVPDVAPSEQSNLVVDGFINPRGTTTIKLTRTFSVNVKNTPPLETRAQVAIQDDAGRRYPLAETATGTYTTGVVGLTLDPDRQYQLRITTAQGRAYASDFTSVVLSPAIDKLNWQLTDVGGIQTYLSTGAPNAAARYYRWEYEETWQFTSAYSAQVEYNAASNTIIPITLERQKYSCWRTEPSTAILQGNTAQLSENTLTEFPLLNVLPSIKLRVGYSLLVRQYAQTQAEYDYWERLRKNTENLGTVNDPLPARVTGNVHALDDPNEPVLGYVGVHSVTEKRLFIDATKQLPLPAPSTISFDPFYEKCEVTELSPQAALEQERRGGLVVIKPNYFLTGALKSYDMSTADCVDCRVRGTNVKPSFWP